MTVDYFWKGGGVVDHTSLENWQAKASRVRISPFPQFFEKGFPRYAWLVCQFHIVFQKLFCKLEPIIRFLLKSQ